MGATAGRTLGIFLVVVLIFCCTASIQQRMMAIGSTNGLRHRARRTRLGITAVVAATIPETRNDSRNDGSGVFSIIGSILLNPKLQFFVALYVILFLLLCFSHRAQTYIIYLHWARPPWVSQLRNLKRYQLASSARTIEANGLQGWHVLPPGPPFAPGGDGTSFYDERLGLPNARIIIFFHGNCGTRGFPAKRVTMLRLLSAHFRAHVITFDYSGFGDSTGRPSEGQLFEDARTIFEWVRARVHSSANVVLYGQSLGSFAAVDVSAALSRETDAAQGVLRAVILDAPPASLLNAARSHPSVAAFRIIPGADTIMRKVIKERLDSLSKIGHITVPLLILHGREDSFIPVDQGTKLYERARQCGNVHAELAVFPGCGHIDVSGSAGYLRVIHRFLSKHMMAFGANATASEPCARAQDAKCA